MQQRQITGCDPIFVVRVWNPGKNDSSVWRHCVSHSKIYTWDERLKGGRTSVADMKFWRPFTMTRVEVMDQTDQRIRYNRIISNELNEPEMSISHEKTRFKNDSVLKRRILCRRDRRVVWIFEPNALQKWRIS